MNQNNTLTQFFLSLLRALRVLRGKMRITAKSFYYYFFLQNLWYNKSLKKDYQLLKMI